MSCPANSLHGFVQLNTNKLTDDQLKSIRPGFGDSAAPFMINYAPRSTPLSFDGPEGSFIIEDQQNTLLFKGVVYTIKSVKLCNNSSSIYKNADHTLIYTFVSQYMETAINTFTSSIQQGKTPVGISSLTAGTPLMIILIVPIYYTNSTNPVNDSYLMQLTNPTTSSSYPNMKTLFTGQKSIMYGACFDIDINSKIFGLTANIYNFIPGITTTLQKWNSILYVNGLPNETRPIGPYIFDDGIQFINKYTTGQPDTTNISTSFMSLPVMDPLDPKFKNQFVYYADDIGTSSKSLKPALIPSNQYQCYPFSELTNLDKAQNVSLDRIIQKDSESANLPPIAPTVAQILGIFAGIVVLLLIILAISLYRNSLGDAIPIKGAVAVVGAPPAAP